MQTNRDPDRSPPRKDLFVIHSMAKDYSGFTLVELVIVLTIVVIVSTIAMKGFTEVKDTARVNRCIGEVRGIEKEIIAWTLERGSYPANLADIGRENMRDPWGRNYVYAPPIRTFAGPPTNNDFDLYSKGDDGLTVNSLVDPVSKDDIIRGRDGSYVGLASKI